MNVIWKYQLAPAGKTSLEIPEGAEYLSVGFQNGVLCLWAKCDTEGPPGKHIFYTVQTGAPLPNEIGLLIGRAMTSDAAYVVHVFQGKV